MAGFWWLRLLQRVSNWFRVPRRTQRRPQRRPALQLEYLESRWIPSVFTVSIPPFPEDTAVTASLPVGPTYDSGSIVAPAHAVSLAFSSNGTFEYTPVPDFNGSDAFVVFA